MIILPEHFSQLFEQMRSTGFLAATRVIGENQLTTPASWVPPFKPLCKECHLREDNKEGQCSFCEAVAKEIKIIRNSDRQKPRAVIWLYSHQEQGISPEGIEGDIFDFLPLGRLIFTRKRSVIEYLLTSEWKSPFSVIVLELNKSIEHFGNTLLMCSYHVKQMRSSDNLAVKFIFSDQQTYNLDWIFDNSSTLSFENIKGISYVSGKIQNAFDFNQRDRLISFLHQQDPMKEYLINHLMQICSYEQKQLLSDLHFLELPFHDAMLVLNLTRFFDD